MLKKYLLFAILCLTELLYAQQADSKLEDTLQGRNYDYLFERIEATGKKVIQQRQYLKYFLKKAKAEKNFEEIVNGYKNYVHHSPENLKLIYADSMIYSAKISGSNELIGSAYISKGIVYYAQKKLKYALDNYLIADSYIARTHDKYLIHKVKYNIANMKYYMGFYNEAISLFMECIDYFKDGDARAYLNSLHLLGLCYNKIGNYGLCTDINEKGVQEGIRLGNNEMNAYFMHSEGVNQYFKNNFSSAIHKISHAIPAISENRDFANESVGYFYIGKSYWDLKKPDQALPYFLKVDKIFDDRQYIRPDLRENYELIIKFYKSRNDLQKQLYYIDKLISVDSILDNEFRYPSAKVRKYYNTNMLLKDKQDIEGSYNIKKYNYIIFIGTLLLFLLLIVAYQFYKFKIAHRPEQGELVNKSDNHIEDEIKNSSRGIEDISKDTISYILKQLEKFERDRKFLEKDLTSIKLASLFNSNPKYLSKVIYHYRGKTFPRYIADLKIDYIIELLKHDRKIRKYSNDALAEEAGFSSTQRFVMAFYANSGIHPSNFIKEIDNSQAD